MTTIYYRENRNIEKCEMASTERGGELKALELDPLVWKVISDSMFFFVAKAMTCWSALRFCWLRILPYKSYKMITSVTK
jgi:hypothetical protein